MGRLQKIKIFPAIEQRATELAGQKVTYILKRSSKRRSIGLRIDHRGLTVNMPLRASESWLQDVLEEKAHWVLEKLTDLQATVISEISWQNGDLLDYLGEQLVLRVLICPLKQPVQRRSSELWVFVNKIGDHAKIERAVKIWFHDEALKIFNERVLHFAFLLNVTPSIVKLSNAKTQWGSCTSRGVVRLNIQLINLPLHLIDYVVVHELAHLFEMNHSKAFWAKVESVCADYLCRRAELKAISL